MSNPLHGVSCEHFGNGSARWSMSTAKENELVELLTSPQSAAASVPSATDLLGVFLMGIANDSDRTAMIHHWDTATREGIDAIHAMLVEKLEARL